MTSDRGNKKVSIRILLSLLLIFSMISLACASGEEPRGTDFLGTWNGIITTPRGKGPVELTVAADESNRTTLNYKIHVGAPNNCKVSSEKGWPEDDVLVLNISETTGGKGGFCNDLWNRSVALKLLDENRVLVQIPYPPTTEEGKVILRKED